MTEPSLDSLRSVDSSASLSSLHAVQTTSSKGTNVASTGAASPPRRQSNVAGAPRGGPETSATKVFVRVRPFNDRERKLQEKGRPVNVIVHVDEQNPAYITTLDPAKSLAPRETYVFERCFNSANLHTKTLEEANQPQLTGADVEACGRDQYDVYGHVGRPVLENAVKGYNGCVFAYGQTGSGKTFTMMGPPDWAGFVAQATYTSENAAAATGFSLDFSTLAARTGAAGRSASQAPTPRTPRGGARGTRSRAGTVLSMMSDQTSVSRGGGAGTGDVLDVSSETTLDEPSYGVEGIVPRLAVELFRALNRRRVEDSSHSFRVEMEYYEIYNEKVMDLLRAGGNTELRIRNSGSGPYVENLTRKTVLHANDVFKLLHKGNAERHTASTKMNDRSSRSHAILTLHLVQVTLASDDTSSKMSSKINLVDLAGSERTGASGVAGQQFKEATKINLSLTTLGRVIDALADLSQGKHGVFCPYRDSNLTWLLMDSLGGNSKTTMVATVSPHPVNFEETCQTLRYASRAKQIVTRATINEDPQARQIRLLQAEVLRLQGLLNGEDDGRDDYVDELKERLSMLQAELDAKTTELEHTYEELAALRSLRATTTAASPAATTGASSAGSASTATAQGPGSPAGGANAKELARLREDVSRLEAENLLLANTERELHDAREQARRAEAKANQTSLVLRSAEKKVADSQASIRRLEKESRETQKLKEKLKTLSKEHADSTEREAQLREAIQDLERSQTREAETGRRAAGGETITARLNRMHSLSAAGSVPVTSTAAASPSRRRSSAAVDPAAVAASAEKAAAEWKLKFEQEQALHSADKQRLREKQAVLRDLETQLKHAKGGTDESRQAIAKQQETTAELEKTRSMLADAELTLGRTQLEADSAIKLKRDLQRRHAEDMIALTDDKNALTAERDSLAAQLEALRTKAAADVARAEEQRSNDVEAAQNALAEQSRAWRRFQAYTQRVTSASQAGLLRDSAAVERAKETSFLQALSVEMAAQAERAADERQRELTTSHARALDALRGDAEAASAVQAATHAQALQAAQEALQRSQDEPTVRSAEQQLQHESLVQARDAVATAQVAAVEQERDTVQADLDALRTDAAAREATQQAQIEALTSERDAAEAALAAEQHVLETTRQHLEHTGVELQRASMTKAALAEHVATLEADRVRLEAELESVSAAKAELEAALEAQRDTGAQSVANVNEELEGVKAQVRALEADKAALVAAHEAALQDADSRFAAERQQAETSHAALLDEARAAHDAEAHALRTELDSAQQVRDESQRALDEAKQRHEVASASAAESLAEVREALHTAEIAHAASDAQTATLTRALAAAEAEKAALQSAVDERTAATEALQAARDQALQRAETAEAAQTEAAAELATLHTQLHDLTNTVETLQAQVEALQTEMADRTMAHDAALQEASARADSHQRAVDTTTAEMTNALAAAEAEKAALQSAVEERDSTVKALEAARDQALQRAETAEAAHADIETQWAANQSQLKDVQADVEETAARLAAREAELQQTVARVDALEAALIVAQDAQTHLESELAAAQDTSQALHEELQARQQDLDSATARVRAAEETRQATEAQHRQADEAAQAAHQQLQDTLARQQQEAATRAAEREAAEAALTESRDAAHAQLAAATAALAEQQQALDAHATHVAALLAQQQTDKAAHAAVVAECTAAQTSAAALEAALEQTTNDKDALVQRLQDAVTAHEGIASAAAQREESLTAQLHLEQERAAAAEAEVSRLQAAVDAAQASAASKEQALASEISDVQAELAAVRAALEAAAQAQADMAHTHADDEAALRRANEAALAALQTALTAQLAESHAQCTALQDELAREQAARAATEASAQQQAETLAQAKDALGTVQSQLDRAKEALHTAHNDGEMAQKKITELEALQNRTVEESAKELAEQLATEEAKYRSLLREREDTIAQLSEDLEFRANLDLCDADAAAASSVNRSFANPQNAQAKSSGLSSLFSLLGRRTSGVPVPAPDDGANATNEMSSELTRRAPSIDPLGSFRGKTGPFT